MTKVCRLMTKMQSRRLQQEIKRADTVNAMMMSVKIHFGLILTLHDVNIKRTMIRRSQTLCPSYTRYREQNSQLCSKCIVITERNLHINQTVLSKYRGHMFAYVRVFVRATNNSCRISWRSKSSINISKRFLNFNKFFFCFQMARNCDRIAGIHNLSIVFVLHKGFFGLKIKCCRS